MKLKRCIKPGCGNIYNEESEEFQDGYCACGAALEDYIPGEEQETASSLMETEHEAEFENEENKTFEAVAAHEDTTEDEEIGEPLIEDGQEQEDGKPNYVITKDMQLVFSDDPQFEEELKREQEAEPVDPFEAYTGDRIIMYNGRKPYKTFPLEYDEVTIGRENSGSTPDIDFTKIDEERFVSRKHALIYRQQGQFKIRNLSSKNTVHVNQQPLSEKQEAFLEDGDKIVLSGRFGLLFKKADDGEKS